MKKLLVLCAAFVGLTVPMAAAPRVFIGARAGFAPFGWYGPGFGPWYGAYGPYGAFPYGIAPNAGQVKFDTKVKDAQVFVNGNFAGTVGGLKTMTMRAGDYTTSKFANLGVPRSSRASTSLPARP